MIKIIMKRIAFAYLCWFVIFIVLGNIGEMLASAAGVEGVKETLMEWLCIEPLSAGIASFLSVRFLGNYRPVVVLSITLAVWVALINLSGFFSPGVFPLYYGLPHILEPVLILIAGIAGCYCGKRRSSDIFQISS